VSFGLSVLLISLQFVALLTAAITAAAHCAFEQVLSLEILV
jgi:hypothetical protein